jgi:hypothetical protein
LKKLRDSTFEGSFLRLHLYPISVVKCTKSSPNKGFYVKYTVKVAKMLREKKFEITIFRQKVAKSHQNIVGLLKYLFSFLTYNQI